MGEAGEPMASGSRMLQQLGLPRNPYVDRTAEKTMLKSGSFYLHSDLQGFTPCSTTYIFFGRRGSGKTTIRLMMMNSYEIYNAEQRNNNKPESFVVDLCRPGRMQYCLNTFMQNLNAKYENWDAAFGENWKSNDLADCILAFAIDDLMRHVSDKTPQGKAILRNLLNDERASAQFLLLAHLYTREDSNTLLKLRRKLLNQKLSVKSIVKAAVVVTGLIGIGAAVYAGSKSYNESKQTGSFNYNDEKLMWNAKIAGGVFGVSVVTTGMVLKKSRGDQSVRRAKELCEPLKVAKPRVELVQSLLDRICSLDDSAEVVRRLYIGASAQQKLELLDSLVGNCGFESLAVFGDCFDEVELLDPLKFPSALKVFAREVCRNEVLNQGRLHFFFPDARASLDLSTDRVVREARFDRHFVRDLTWSRFQLQDLAERRFLAAQSEAGSTNPVAFSSLFEHVKKEDFSASISKLETPRELMVFMTELLARLEAHSEDNSMVAAQDMEIAVQKAQEQSV